MRAGENFLMSIWNSFLKAEDLINRQQKEMLASILGPKGMWENLMIRLHWAPKSLQMVTAAMKLKDDCYLEEKLWQT